MSSVIKAEVRFNQGLKKVDRELARMLSAGIAQIAATLIPIMRLRIGAGHSSQGGYFRALGADSVPLPGPGLFWVSPKRPQPAGFIAEVKAGDGTNFGGWDATKTSRIGWKGYRTYKHYCELLGSPPRRFVDSGLMMSALVARIDGPRKVSLVFVGSRKTTTGRGKTSTVRFRDIAYINSRNEPLSMLTPSASEIRTAMVGFEGDMQAALDGVARDAEQVTALRKRAEGLQKRVAAVASRR